MKTPIASEGPGSNEGAGREDAAAKKAAAAIRERSAASQLISESEILNLLNAEPFTPLEAGQDIHGFLTQLVDDHKDLHGLPGTGFSWYYSSDHMTEAYATLLLHRQDGPLRLIAETVRQNAGTYRRPVPLDLFTRPPFNLTHDQALESLAMMTETEGYGDIARTTTSASGIYLYCKTHLEADHAAMLAEWLDVGQFENP
ncbi:MAG: hypothetical protein LLG93_09320 [Deltaproteobacteria bacterium]|nr:hypothetical protein [Deltaproteobacteria bacterium]